MKDTLTIPETLNVGFQNRKDTYTGKLAYVVYTDKTGKLRKEASWTSWCDAKIKKLELKNEPTSGFVLNRDVGGARDSYSSWNIRIEKVRVYDPRGFEFEIDIPNLLYVLQECSSIKGKGLEGEFVYSWNGTQLILLPVTSQEYTNSVSYGKLQEEKVSQEEMVVGCAYLTKKKENVIYMGKHPWWGIPSTYGCSKAGAAKHIFARTEILTPRYSWSTPEKLDYARPDAYILDTGFTKLAKRTSTSPVPQYAGVHDKLMKSCLLSKPSKIILTDAKTGNDQKNYWHVQGAIQVTPDAIVVGRYQEDNRAYYQRSSLPKSYSFIGSQRIHLKNGRLQLDAYEFRRSMTTEEAKVLCKSVVVECENKATSTIYHCTI